MAKKARSSAGRAPRAKQLAVERLDAELVKLLNARAAATVEAPDSSAAEALAARLAEPGPGRLDATAVAAVFRELFSGVRALRRPVRAAYLGPEYTYSHLAAIARFGQSAELSPVGSIAAVFQEVERGHADFGVVPIENSTDGRVADSLECFVRCRSLNGGGHGTPAGPAGGDGRTVPQVCGEVPLRIRHCLLGVGVRGDVRRVYSKTQPLSQCRNWLAAHLPQAQLSELASTAEAATLAQSEPDAAAIASEQAGVRYGLKVLARGIEDNPDNVTRFAVIGATPGERTGRDKTAIAFETPHQPGALADAMGVFKRQRLNLTWIESFPIPEARGRYLFFVEFQGHPSELRARRALAALEKKAVRLVVLGSFAEAAVVG